MKGISNINRLKELREAAGLSRPALADLLGIGEHQIRRMETGEVLISTKHIGPLTDCLDTTADHLLGFDRTGAAA